MISFLQTLAPPRLSTPEPANVERWPDELGLDFSSLLAAPPEQPAYKPTSLTLKKPLELAFADYDAKMQASQQATADSSSLNDLIASSLGSGTGKPGGGGGNFGLSYYGVSRSGDPSQKGTAPYGLQTSFWSKLAQANAAMKAAGLGTFGITDGFRSYAGQVSAKKRKGKLAATPGRSVHGIGRAADLRLTSRQQKWLEANAGKFGIRRLPSESWHWQEV